jgi:predicted SprT family Zn-dependent metalloprotease
MTSRYFKATDGQFTIFRSTTARTYQFADLTARDGLIVAMGFGNLKGALKAIEIDKAEYASLVAAKNKRTKALHDKRAAAGLSNWRDGPSDSWVFNADLAQPEPVAPKAHDRIGFEEAAPRAVVAKDPTKTTYLSLVQAYDYLNAELWAGKLPTCLVTLQRKANCGGYFAGARFKTRDGKHHTDEIALNPSHFESTDTRYILSILGHEMCHLEQFHFGKPAKGGYHNKEWGALMKAIGLKPVSVDQPGKEVGNKVGHTIDAGGRFDLVCAALLKQGIQIDYVEAWSNEGKAKAKAKLKTKYSCPQCGQNAWAKPGANLACGDCDETMEAEEG